MPLIPRRLRPVLGFLAGAVAYGFWWNLIDAAPEVGQRFGSTLGVNLYQAINIVGHFLVPFLLFAALRPSRLRLAVAQGLLSSIIMDSPLWGTVYQFVYGGLPFGLDWWTWSLRYFSPGDTTVWWSLYGVPVTGSLVFSSLVLRGTLLLIVVASDRVSHSAAGRATSGSG